MAEKTQRKRTGQPLLVIAQRPGASAAQCLPAPALSGTNIYRVFDLTTRVVEVLGIAGIKLRAAALGAADEFAVL